MGNNVCEASGLSERGSSMKHAALAVALALVACVGLEGTANAQDLTDLAKKAKAAAKDGKDLEAYDTMRQATLKVWRSGPLLFRKAIFVKKAPAGFGVYDPHPDGIFKPGEKLYIYVEPVGFTWKDQDGLKHAQLVADLVLKDSEGTVLGEQEGFGTFTFDIREQITEVMTSLAFDFPEAPAGKYTAELKFTDKLGKKSATFELPFEIKKPGADDPSPEQ